MEMRKEKKKSIESPTLLNTVLGNSRGTERIVRKRLSTHILITSPRYVPGRAIRIC
jgi:hypothetical protein